MIPSKMTVQEKAQIQSASTRTFLKDRSPEIIGKIHEQRAAGLSLRAIAAGMKLSHGSVQRLLKKEANAGEVVRAAPRIPRRP